MAIYDKTLKRVVSFFPIKSCSKLCPDDVGEEKDFEEFYEGTMINMFWYDIIGDWEITTRSNIGANVLMNLVGKLLEHDF